MSGWGSGSGWCGYFEFSASSFCFCIFRRWRLRMQWTAPITMTKTAATEMTVLRIMIVRDERPSGTITFGLSARISFILEVLGRWFMRLEIWDRVLSVESRMDRLHIQLLLCEHEIAEVIVNADKKETRKSMNNGERTKPTIFDSYLVSRELFSII